MFKRDSNSLFSRYVQSFGYAFSGIKKVFISERNFRFHSLAAILVVSLGFVLNITHTEWLFVILAIGLVITAEALNTAIEKLVDLVSPEKNTKAGWVKDVAAGAVLLASICAFVIGLLVFVPYLV